MSDYCSTFCGKWTECGMLGIHAFMKVIPKHPDDLPNKNWCSSFEEGEEKSKDS